MTSECHRAWVFVYRHMDSGDRTLVLCWSRPAQLSAQPQKWAILWSPVGDYIHYNLAVDLRRGSGLWVSTGPFLRPRMLLLLYSWAAAHPAHLAAGVSCVPGRP